jgi:predicted ester cyclase
VRLLLVGFPDLHIRIEELIGDAESVVARLTMMGTNTGEYRGLPEPTNKRFENEAIAIFRVADGKVTEIRGTADRLTMLIQLGILPDIG